MRRVAGGGNVDAECGAPQEGSKPWIVDLLLISGFSKWQPIL